MLNVSLSRIGNFKVLCNGTAEVPKQMFFLVFFSPLGILVIDSHRFAVYDLWRLDLFWVCHWGTKAFSSLPVWGVLSQPAASIQHHPSSTPGPQSDSVQMTQSKKKKKKSCIVDTQNRESWGANLPVFPRKLFGNNKHKPLNLSLIKEELLFGLSIVWKLKPRSARNQELEQREGVLSSGIWGSWRGARSPGTGMLELFIVLILIMVSWVWKCQKLSDNAL